MPLLTSIDSRILDTEIMDDPDVDRGLHLAALRGIARINRFSGSAAVLLPALLQSARSRRGRELRVLDVATGSGDVPIALKRTMTSYGFPNLRFFGCDVSETALDAARTNAVKQKVDVRFFHHDIYRSSLKEEFDVVMCSLFLHHLSDEEAVVSMRRMKDAATGKILVNDLIRSRLNYLTVWMTCRLLTRSKMVHIDGPLSVRKAFTVDEVRRLAAEAGMPNATVERRRPGRFLLHWTR